MPPRTRSNPLALAVLTLLSERDMHPYEISSTLRERHKEESIKLNYGSLYAVVDSLHKRGLITPTETVREGRRPERTVYAITEAGATEMAEWLSDLLARPAKEFPQFEAALSLMLILSPDEVLDLLRQRLERLRTAHREYEDATAAAPRSVRLFLIEHEYEAALRHAEIEFVEQLVAELASGDFAGLEGWREIHAMRAAGKTIGEVEAALAARTKEAIDWLTEQG